MKGFVYEKATDFQDAAAIKTTTQDAEFIAGGTDLLGEIKREILPHSPGTLVDLKYIEDGKGISVKDGIMEIGALTTLTQVLENEDVKREFPILAESAHSIASPLIRNQGTIGGNICQDVRCWFYRYPNEAAGRLNCARKCGEECYAIHGENRYHSIFGGYKICQSECTKACPAGTDIPAYMNELRHGNWEEAANIIMSVNPMPMITARICPHPCQDACNQYKHGDSVGIHCVERSVGDYILKNADKFYKAPESEVDKKVGIIGAGPAGLTAAYFLRKAGYDITVIDRMEKAGGVLMYGIPHYRLPKNIVTDYTKALENMGIKFELGVEIGKDISMEAITEKYDEVFIGTGAWKQPVLGIHGEEMTQFGLNFLVEVNTYLKKVTSFGDNILVCGGGNVAMDVALTAVRLGAKKITLCCLEKEEEMPAQAEEIARAKEEGVTIINGKGLDSIIEKDGKVTGLKTKKCVSVFDEKGRFAPVYDDTETEVIDADTIILATGQRVDIEFLGEKFAGKIKSARGLLNADEETGITSMSHVYGGGDAVTGPNIAIRAIAGGLAAARTISRKLGMPVETIKEHRTIEYDPEGVENRIAVTLKDRAVTERTLTDEDTETLTDEDTIKEASRCMDCGCYAVAPSDIAPVLITLGASIVTNKRTFTAEELFCTDPRVKKVLDPDEIVIKITIPTGKKGKGQYKKFRLRKSLDFAIVSVASYIYAPDGIVKEAKLVFGSVAPMPRVADDVAEYIIGKTITSELAEEAAALAVKEAKPLRYNAHKIEILKSLVRDSILEAK